MKYKDCVASVGALLRSELILSDYPRAATEEPMPDCSPLISEVNPRIPRQGFGRKSGVYFICNAERDVYYIGKATQNNLHEEIWGKVCTPEVDAQGYRQYPKNYFRSRTTLPSQCRDAVTSGGVRLGIVTMTEPALASLAEVYLQSIYLARVGNLPPLNSRIG